MRADLPDRLDGLADALERRRYPDNAELVREAALALRALRDAPVMELSWADCRYLGIKYESQRVRLVVVGEEG